MRTHFFLFLSCLFCFALLLVSGCGSENAAPSAEQEFVEQEAPEQERQVSGRMPDRALGCPYCGWSNDANVMADSLPLSPGIFSRIPQRHREIFYQIHEAITNEDEAEAGRLAQECIALAEMRGENPNVIHTLHWALGLMLMNASMFDSAHRHLSEVAKRGGENVYYAYLLALCVARSGDVDGGLSMLLNEIDRDPSIRDASLLYIIGILVLQVKPPSETMFEKIDSLMKSIETEGHISTRTSAALVSYWSLRGKRERAIPLCEELLTQGNLNHPEDIWVRNNLARLYSDVLGQHQQALEIVDKALATSDNPFLFNTRGLILINAGNPKEAIFPLQRAVALSTDIPVFRMHFAYALHLDGFAALSRQYFDAARDQLIPLVHTMIKEDKAMYDALLLAHP